MCLFLKTKLNKPTRVCFTVKRPINRPRLVFCRPKSQFLHYSQDFPHLSPSGLKDIYINAYRLTCSFQEGYKFLASISTLRCTKTQYQLSFLLYKTSPIFCPQYFQYPHLPRCSPGFHWCRLLIFHSCLPQTTGPSHAP